jgi:alpha-galactosidase
MISNLPADCCAEGPVFADKTGLNKVHVGDIPSQCAALNLTNINVQRLTVEAAIEGDPEKVVMACSLDPLTGATLTLKEIREMVAEMIEAQRIWLPQFEGKTVKSTPTIVIPEGMKRANVPIEPALAIFARIGELAKED